MKKRKPKVCLVIPSFEPGGAERVMTVMAARLVERNVDVVLVAISGSGILRAGIPSEVRILDLGIRRVRNAVWPLFKLLRRERPDALLSTLGHLNLVIGILRPFFPATRFVAREASIPSMNMLAEKNGNLVRHLYRAIYPIFDRVVCQSRFMLEDMRDSVGLPAELLTVIYNPVDVDGIVRRCDGTSPFLPGRKILLFVGRLGPEKQPLFLAQILEQFADDPRVELHIVGDGKLRETLRKNLAQKGLEKKAFFWGHQENPYVFMRHADCLILTSAYEGFPNVVLEAGACGIPAIAFASPGITEEIIADGVNGWLVPPGNVKAMVEKIRQVPLNVAQPNLIREHIRARFSVSSVTEAYKTLLLGRAPD